MTHLRDIPPEVPRANARPGEHVLETTLRGVEQQIDTRGWDQPTVLYRLIWVDGGAYVAEDVPWFNRDPKLGFSYPPAVIGALATAISRAEPTHPVNTLLDRQYVGWILTVEAWSASGSRSDPSLRADLAARRIDRRPDRYESRLCYLGTRNRQRLLLARRRGDLLPRVDWSWHPPDTSTADPVAEAMERLLGACDLRTRTN